MPHQYEIIIIREIFLKVNFNEGILYISIATDDKLNCFRRTFNAYYIKEKTIILYKCRKCCKKLALYFQVPDCSKLV